MPGRGRHFGQRESPITPSNDVARAGDLDLGLIISALHGAGTICLEKFRMKRPTVELKNQLGDFWSYGKHCNISFFIYSAIEHARGKHEHGTLLSLTEAYYNLKIFLGERPLCQKYFPLNN
jgi:hypothetical protein